MFEKILSSIGVGSAKVDTVVLSEHVAPGEVLKGVVKVYGGKTRQSLTGVQLEVVISCQQESEYSDFSEVEKTVVTNILPELHIVGAGEEASYPFSIQLPLDTPLSTANHQTRLRTQVLMPHTPDPRDLDDVVVQDKTAESVKAAFKELGYSETNGSGKCFQGETRYIQQFTYCKKGATDREEHISASYRFSETHTELSIIQVIGEERREKELRAGRHSLVATAQLRTLLGS